MNPFHFLGQPKLAYKGHPLLTTKDTTPDIPLEDYVEMVEAVIDIKDIRRPFTFETLRSHIPETDISDFQLNLVIEKLK